MNEEEKKDPEKERKPDQRKRNPRIVLNDPEKFFSDLLMEQQEQQ